MLSTPYVRSDPPPSFATVCIKIRRTLLLSSFLRSPESALLRCCRQKSSTEDKERLVFLDSSCVCLVKGHSTFVYPPEFLFTDPHVQLVVGVRCSVPGRQGWLSYHSSAVSRVKLWVRTQTHMRANSLSRIAHAARLLGDKGLNYLQHHHHRYCCV